MNYLEEVDKGMQLLANSESIIIGQAVNYKGHCLTRQAAFWPDTHRVEMPVAEDFQTGFALGMAIDGHRVVSIYPRMNFVVCAMNQILNHLDKWEAMRGGQLNIVLKGVVGSAYPLNPGHQHQANWAEQVKGMCSSIKVHELLYPHQVMPVYEEANIGGVHLVVEHGDLYAG